MTKLPLEDEFTDILGKAQRGKNVSLDSLAKHCGCTVHEIRKVLSGDMNESIIRGMCELLKLNRESLMNIAKGQWHPGVDKIDGMEIFTTPFSSFTVNAFVLWNPKTLKALIFDTGTDCSGILEFIKTKELDVEFICITHAHSDHIADLGKLRTAFKHADVMIGNKEVIPGAQGIEEGYTFTCGGLEVRTLLTNGHSPGGLTYVVQGLEQDVAVVRDSLFAGSMGGGRDSYDLAVKNNMEKILQLSKDTIICPGHGPLSSVGLELAGNPFFS